MKKIIIAIMSLFMIMSFATMAAAGPAAETTTGGADVVIGGTSDTGGALTYNPSPSTVMSVKSLATSFTIISASSKTTTTTGIEYGIKSSETDVFQMRQATDGEVSTPTSATELGGTFTDKAGNSTS